VTDQNDQQDDDIYVIDESGDVVSGDPDPEEVSGLDISPESQPNAAASPDKEALAKELRELKDQYLRSRADFENFRRRNEREKSDYFRHALSGVMRELLPVVDNFERALASGAEGGEDFRKGIELIARSSTFCRSRVCAQSKSRALHSIRPFTRPLRAKRNQTFQRTRWWKSSRRVTS
jgi:molecular chaperone GrpE (heat shock protein)